MVQLFWISPFRLTNLLAMSQLNIAEPQAPLSTTDAQGVPSNPIPVPNESDQTAQESAVPWYKNKALWGVVALVVILVGVYFFGYNKYSSQGHLYFWPESTDDWGVWGTWAAVLVGGGAVFYAATQVRLAAVSQSDDRKQRVKAEHQEKIRHAELVAAQNRLKVDQDRSARIGAKKLALEAGLNSLPMARSEEEHQERQSEMYQDMQNQADVIPYDHDPRIETIDHVYVHLTNVSDETTFKDLSLQFGVNVAAVDLIKVEKRNLRPILGNGSATPLAIDPIATLSPVLHQGVKQWLLPDLSPGEQVRATFRFKSPQIEIDWWSASSQEEGVTRQLNQRISLGFRGPAQRYWIRLTDMEAKEQPFRLWELGN